MVRNSAYVFTAYPLPPEQADSKDPEVWQLALDKGPAWSSRTMKYLLYTVQKTPSTGRIHLQGYVQYKSGQQLSDAKKYLGISLNCHCEIQRGTVDQCILYIKDDEKKTNCIRPEYKEDSKEEKSSARYYMFEMGTPDQDIMVQQKKQGQRSDLLEIREMIRSGTKREEIRDLYPDLFTKYGKTIGEWLSEKQDSFVYKIPDDCPWIDDPTTDDTCNAIGNYIGNPTDSRTILWIWSVSPKKGKTTYLKWIYNEVMGKQEEPREYKVFYNKAAPAKELAYLWQGEMIVCLDTPRDLPSDKFPYEFIEALKDGLVTSTKYEPVKKRPNISGEYVWIVVAANYPPSGAHLSDDRCIVINLDLIVNNEPDQFEGVVL